MSVWRVSLTAAFIWVAQAGTATDNDLSALYVERLDGSEVKFTLEDLDALEQVGFSTSTVWTDGINHFSGVSILNLLEHAEAEGSTLRMVALNDYSIEMPVEELDEKAPIVASRMNGDTMSIREKGPFWVIYPFDSDPEFASEINRSRSVWQLSRLVLVK
ncbi:putative pterin-binding protein [Ovoidimarina sediminis]|uniref:oxidoreductase n=1 Tax=Ovoidimarina sediminis TaxID=3079856 RepID=UPI00290B3205|nr:oxidoreductase [Rhodophyticola sp. MJ-SS7]MDU8945512.1 oxidoreductase [Rhodophyticola sp. MJ-SS7]